VISSCLTNQRKKRTYGHSIYKKYPCLTSTPSEGRQDAVLHYIILINKIFSPTSSSAKIKNVWRCTTTPPLHLHNMQLRHSDLPVTCQKGWETTGSLSDCQIPCRTAVQADASPWNCHCEYSGMWTYIYFISSVYISPCCSIWSN
jgi:hypothetical protein